MKEARWRTCKKPLPMLRFLGRSTRRRKLRLFAVACCRRILHLISEGNKQTLELAEKHADGILTSREMFAASESLPPYWGAATLLQRSAWLAAEAAAYRCGLVRWDEKSRRSEDQPEVQLEQSAQAQLIREIFGNPFRPVSINPSWLTWNDATVPKIAQRIYEEGAFTLLPILADALEDAGCADEAILHHCREPGEHVRGCWVVDLLLGKE